MKERALKHLNRMEEVKSVILLTKSEDLNSMLVQGKGVDLLYSLCASALKSEKFLYLLQNCVEIVEKAKSLKEDKNLNEFLELICKMIITK